MRSRVSRTALVVVIGVGLQLASPRTEARAAVEAGPADPAATGTTASSSAPAAGEVEALRRELADLREQIRILRDQVSVLQARAPGAAPAAPGSALQPGAAALTPAPAETVYQPAGAGQAGIAPARSQNLMNPAISAVFQAIGTTSLRQNDDRNGFDLSEAEIALQSVIDPYARFDMFLSFPSQEAPEVEEGYVTTLALPHSLQVKGGRFKTAFGKWNTLHNHAFFTVDRPNALTNFFGEESLADDGLSLSFLIPNPWNLYIESSTQVGTPRPGNSFNSVRRGLLYLQHLSWFFTTTTNSNFEVGLSAARGRTGPSDSLRDSILGCGLFCTGLQPPRDELDSAVDGVDLTYKWKPLRLNVYKSFLWQTEVLRSHRDVERLDAIAPALLPDKVSSLGGYSYLEWQLAKRWRIGGRYDLSGFPDERTARERAGVAVVRFQPSEFQELRFQYKRTMRNAEAAARFGGDETDNELFFEWIPVIGAHGAHKF